MSTMTAITTSGLTTFDPKSINDTKKVHSVVSNESEMLKLWSTQGIREEYLNKRYNSVETTNTATDELFTFGNGKSYFVCDGPPFATGTPHYGHILAGSLKDVEIRYKTLCGYNVTKMAGFDVHGVPMEMRVNKLLDISTKTDIYELGLNNYCNKCRESVLTCADDWSVLMKRYARWAEFENPYTTMDIKFTEAVWSNFALLYKNNHIRKGYRVSAYSTALETCLSNFEASSNYEMKSDNTLTFRVKLIGQKLFDGDLYVSVYTTTPWTLPGNIAMAVNKDLKYLIVKDEDSSTATVTMFTAKSKKTKNIVAEIMGEQLVGITYEPLFNFYNYDKDFYKVHHGDFVDDKTGTGIVHCAPMFGESDFDMCCAKGLVSKTGTNLNDYLSSTGELNEEIGKYFDKEYKPTVCHKFNQKIIKHIKQNMPTNFVKTEQITHSYPYCERSNTPLIYRATPSWMVNVSDFRDELVKLNKQIEWSPQHVGEGRFNEWLSNARDWNISRSRFWGTPMPVWANIEDNNDLIIIESAAELEKYANLEEGSLKDLHRDKIDDIIIQKNGKTYRRISDVFDCWYDSGSVPTYFNKDFVQCDFIAEGMDQTRGWFYTMLVLGYIRSKYTTESPQMAYKSVMVNGLVLAEDGKKMSKRLQNYTDPTILMDKYGADSMRMYLLSSGAAYGDNLKFSDEGVSEMLRQVLIQLHSTCNLLDIYKKVHVKKNKEMAVMPMENNDYVNLEFPKMNEFHKMNKWIMNKTYMLEKQVHKSYESHKFNNVVHLITDFVEVLNNTYVKLMRPIFKDNTKKHENCYVVDDTIMVTSFVLLRLGYLMAPVAPFFADYLFNQVKNTFRLTKDLKSVHLHNYKDFYSLFIDNINNTNIGDLVIIDKQLELLDGVRTLCQVNNHPKSKMLKDVTFITDSFDELLKEIELEIGAVALHIMRLSDMQVCPIDYIIEFDQKMVGKEFKKDREAVVKHICNNQNLINKLFNKENVTVWINEKTTHIVTPDMVSNYSYKMSEYGEYYLKRLFRQDGNEKFKSMVGKDYVVMVDMSDNQYMIDQMVVQNIARKFQKLRKECGVIPTDPVKLYMTCSDNVNKLYEEHQHLFTKITDRCCNINKDTSENIRIMCDFKIDELNETVKLIVAE